MLRSGGIWNGDGWDPDSSTNCTLFATEFETEDDSVPSNPVRIPKVMPLEEAAISQSQICTSATPPDISLPIQIP